jgi:hypothetical protein
LVKEEEGVIYGNNGNGHDDNNWHTAHARGYPELAKLEVFFRFVKIF